MLSISYAVSIERSHSLTLLEDMFNSAFSLPTRVRLLSVLLATPEVIEKKKFVVPIWHLGKKGHLTI